MNPNIDTPNSFKSSKKWKQQVHGVNLESPTKPSLFRVLLLPVAHSTSELKKKQKKRKKEKKRLWPIIYEHNLCSGVRDPACLTPGSPWRLICFPPFYGEALLVWHTWQQRGIQTVQGTSESQCSNKSRDKYLEFKYYKSHHFTTINRYLAPTLWRTKIASR